MPRMGRIVLPNYPHHVVQRGHNRQVVFAAEQDYQCYIADLRDRKGDRFIYLAATAENKSVPFFKQGSESWALGSGRLEKAVGDRMIAADIADSIKAARTETWVVTTRPDGSTIVEVLDTVGRSKPIDTSNILIPDVNLSGAKL